MRVLTLAAALGGAAVLSQGMSSPGGGPPPMGWRSWNQFGLAINQSLIEAQYRALAGDRSRLVDGKPTSLKDLGFIHAGIDDGWQACGAGQGGGFHTAAGRPIINTTLFPDMKAMTAVARSLGLVPGWYANNCHCHDDFCKADKCFEGDVNATVELGFGSSKIDACGAEKNMSLWYSLFKARSPEPMMLEDCWNGYPYFPTVNASGQVSSCPMNMFRVSGDIFPAWGSIITNIVVAAAHAAQNQSTLGCWVYPDMLEVGVTSAPRLSGGVGPLTLTEARSHFGMWCVMSSPLILGMDLTDSKALDRVWDILSNRDAIAVNQAWAGDSGRLVSTSAANVTIFNCSFPMNGKENNCTRPAWLVFAKRINATATAAVLVNNRQERASVPITWTDAGVDCTRAAGCALYNVWARAPQGRVHGDTWSATLEPHGSAFVTVVQDR